jgi:hypothetical protein
MDHSSDAGCQACDDFTNDPQIITSMFLHPWRKGWFDWHTPVGKSAQDAGDRRGGPMRTLLRESLGRNLNIHRDARRMF